MLILGPTVFHLLAIFSFSVFSCCITSAWLQNYVTNSVYRCRFLSSSIGWSSNWRRRHSPSSAYQFRLVEPMSSTWVPRSPSSRRCPSRRCRWSLSVQSVWLFRRQVGVPTSHCLSSQLLVFCRAGTGTLHCLKAQAWRKTHSKTAQNLVLPRPKTRASPWAFLQAQQGLKYCKTC